MRPVLKMVHWGRDNHGHKRQQWGAGLDRLPSTRLCFSGVNAGVPTTALTKAHLFRRVMEERTYSKSLAAGPRAQGV